MDNNEVVPGFDDQRNPDLTIQIEILFDLFVGCLLLLRPAGVINPASITYCRKQMERVIEAGYYRIVFSLREVSPPCEKAAWLYLSELRRTLRSLRGELLLTELTPLQNDDLLQLNLGDQFITCGTPEEAMSFYRDYETGNRLEEGLQLAVWYYRRFWYYRQPGHDLGYEPANLEVCERIYGIVKKRSYTDEDYETAKRSILELLTARFHAGCLMWDVISAVDQWLSDNWRDFSKGSLTLQARDRFFWPSGK